MKWWSVLDQSLASDGSREERAIRESLVLARQCDALGDERFWVSEHHNAASIVGSEIVINTRTFDPGARRHSYEILAAALGLGGAASVS